MKQILITLAFIYTTIAAMGQTTTTKGTVEGKVIDKTNHTVVPYVNVLILNDDSKLGTTTNNDGIFRFTLNKKQLKKQFYVSAIGYKDTLIQFNQFGRNKVIALTPKVYQLEEVKVSAQPIEKFSFGSKDYRISQTDLGYSSVSDLSVRNSKNFSACVYIKPKKTKEQIVLRSISFCIRKAGPLQGKFLLRLLQPDKRLPLKILYPFSKCKDLQKEPIILTAKKRGWNDFDCSKHNIVLPNKPFVIILQKIDQGDTLAWGNESYGSLLAYYATNKLPLMQPAVQYYDKVSRVKILNVPAIVLNCWRYK
ncbi:MAG: hypothetical protein CSA94_00510 [Bacteroidetes bacterium]|nr:MAG: hypothetical protein CSA94_00510 [Bacteroidota bacterium]